MSKFQSYAIEVEGNTYIVMSRDPLCFDSPLIAIITAERLNPKLDYKEQAKQDILEFRN